ncbi:MAG: HNH endonuclease signature motif containing protein, partial [Nocardioides sp.]
ALAAAEPDPAVVDAHEDALLYDEEAAARARTRLTLHDNRDGTITGHFTVPVLQGHLLRKVVETITAPRRGRLGDSEAQAGPARGPRTDWDHARGLAFCELLEHLPTDHLHRRTAATLVVTVRDDVLRGSLAAAGLDTAESVSSGEARRMACAAGILPAVLGGASVPLDLGRLRRLFSEHQRVGLGLTHRTCAASGCERPFAWCELHHRRPWASQGRTDLADAVLLCHFHHRRIHDTGFRHAQLPDGRVRFSRRT